MKCADYTRHAIPCDPLFFPGVNYDVSLAGDESNLDDVDIIDMQLEETDELIESLSVLSASVGCGEAP
jgi:hypothetical protein